MIVKEEKTMELKYINLKIEDGVSRIQFNRPQKLNAVNPDVLPEFCTQISVMNNSQQYFIFTETCSGRFNR